MHVDETLADNGRDWSIIKFISTSNLSMIKFNLDLILVGKLLLPWWALALPIPNLMLFAARSQNARRGRFTNYS